MAPTSSRERLIETAIEMVWKNSYSSVSVDDICKAADVRKGSFYHHFKSKAELAVEAMEQHYQKAKSDFDKVFSADLSENFAVLLMVCLLFGLYFVLIIIARRFDRRDLDKV